MQASIAIQVLPDVQSEDELIRIVDEVIAYIKSTGLNCYVGPFETTVEGDSYPTTFSLATKPVIAATAAFQSPQPSGVNIHAIALPIDAKIL